MIGLGSEKILKTRTIGPLLKSISSEVQLYASKISEPAYKLYTMVYA